MTGSFGKEGVKAISKDDDVWTFISVFDSGETAPEIAEQADIILAKMMARLHLKEEGSQEESSTELDLGSEAI